MEPASGVADPAVRALHRPQRAGRFQPHQLRYLVFRPVRHSGQLRRLPGVGYLESRPPGPPYGLRLSRLAKRRFGLPHPDVRLGRGPERTRRLRDPGRDRHRQPRAPPRHPHFRHHRHRAPEVPHERADLSRLAHPHGRYRPARHRERLHLCLRLRPGPLGQRAGGLLGGLARSGLEHRLVPHRGHPGAARPPRAGGDRQFAAHFQRPCGAGPPR